MDILYYSNYCKHSQRIIQFFTQNDLVDKVNFICIDKRRQDPTTGQVYILLENGTQILLPPNVHSVPALLLVKESYRVVLGDEIMSKYHTKIQENKNVSDYGGGEPVGYSFSSGGEGIARSSEIVSEQYTFYNATPQELSTKGSGGLRQMYNYVSVNSSIPTIVTPPDTYRPDKLSKNITVDMVQKTRNEDISKTTGYSGTPAFMPPAKNSSL